MKNLLRLLIGLCTVVLWHLFIPRDAHAYLDPGTGSYILQILIAAVVGGLFVFKPFFTKIKSFFRKIFGKETGDDQVQE